jgi:peptidoglycan/LPS O-acetylase OafA/YrhL
MSDLLKIESWHTKPGGGLNLFRGLDGIRAIAIFLVVCCHTVPFLYMDSLLKRCLCVL